MAPTKIDTSFLPAGAVIIDDPTATTDFPFGTLGAIIVNTIAVAFGGFLCITITGILVGLLELLANRTLRSPDYQTPSEDEPPPYDGSGGTNKVRGVVGMLTGFGYLFASFVTYMSNEGNETVLSTTLSTVILVVGVVIGLAVTVAVGMGLVKCGSHLSSRYSEVDEPGK